jgi:hypothetical protein
MTLSRFENYSIPVPKLPDRNKPALDLCHIFNRRADTCKYPTYLHKSLLRSFKIHLILSYSMIFGVWKGGTDEN